MIKITGPDGEVTNYDAPPILMDLARKYQRFYNSPLAAGIVNGKPTYLYTMVRTDATVDFVELASDDGMEMYERTLLFVLFVATQKARPEIVLEVRNSDTGFVYLKIKNGIYLSKYDVADIKAAMREIIAAKKVFTRRVFLKDEATDALQRTQIKNDIMPLINLLPDNMLFPCYELEGMVDLVQDILLPDTSYVGTFDLAPYKQGLLLTYPDKDDLFTVRPFVERPRIFEIYENTERWCEIMECATIAQLNRYIEAGQDREIIQVAEGLQEKWIVHIADTIKRNRSKVRIIFIAGPSSSGKSSFAMRLSVQLRVNGQRPHVIAMDDFFKDRKDTPRKEDGSYDFESVNALDVALFQDCMTRLLQGEELVLPTYNFRTGCREYKKEPLRIDERDVLIIEGIHGLNDKLTSVLPAEKCFKIFVSALTPLSLDDHNRISISDMRLIRRTVRDYYHRGHKAIDTFRMWPAVLAGEIENIMPYEENADIMMNTTLIYEIAALKTEAEKLLRSITKDQGPYYEDAQRILTLLSCVLPINQDAIPNNSVIREFLGNSIFYEVL